LQGHARQKNKAEDYRKGIHMDMIGSSKVKGLRPFGNYRWHPCTKWQNNFDLFQHNKKWQHSLLWH